MCKPFLTIGQQVDLFEPRAKKAASPQVVCGLVRIAMVVREGVEPPTRGFSVLCSTN